jgi:hypothetical protein
MKIKRKKKKSAEVLGHLVGHAVGNLDAELAR